MKSTKPEKEIEVGDVVYLKSGSPALTVVNLTTEGEPGAIQTMWYESQIIRLCSAPKQCFTFSKPSVAKTR